MTIQKLDTRYGTMFVPDTDRGQYWWLSNTGASPEDSFIEDICKLLDERPKGTAVDVGANFGCWTLPLACHAHHVISFEPQSVCYKLLLDSITINNLKNVTALNCAAGCRPGSVLIPKVSLDEGTNFGGISLEIPHHEQPDAPTELAAVNRLDDILMGEPVSFIKIDVEGYEQKVVDGALETIMRCKPVLFIEMDHALTDAARLKATLEELDYAVDKMGGNYLGLPL